ncbi:MAG TPA: 30S ribosomal protein S17 [Candidatus Nitrosopolaris sp.]|nr:30S ribosomal protein S17 [Candidatus Nitrosopolaris sp.]
MARNIGIAVTPPEKTCADILCPFHGRLSVRGKLLSGIVVSAKAKNMIVVSREFPHQVSKYQRYERSRSRLHAYLPECIEVTEGDEISIAECRPLSKTVSFVVIKGSKGIGT